METLRLNAHRILSREAVQSLLDNLKKEHKTLVEELVPATLSVGQVQKVLQLLLSEGVPIRDLVTILETLGEYAHLTKDPEMLSEAVRNSLGESIAARFKDEKNTINAITLDPQLEHLVSEGISKSAQQGIQYIFPPDIFRRLHRKVSKAAEEVKNKGLEITIVTTPNVRRFFRKFLEPFMPQAAVLSFAELPPKIQIKSVNTISLTDED
jgi:flagellar biosynthesis protein FlhA